MYWRATMAVRIPTAPPESMKSATRSAFGLRLTNEALDLSSSSADVTAIIESGASTALEPPIGVTPELDWSLGNGDGAKALRGATPEPLRSFIGYAGSTNASYSPVDIP